jgi:hypothetical protein
MIAYKLRIKDVEEFEKVAKNVKDYDNFSIELTENEKKDIENRKKNWLKLLKIQRVIWIK